MIQPPTLSPGKTRKRPSELLELQQHTYGDFAEAKRRAFAPLANTYDQQLFARIKHTRQTRAEEIRKSFKLVEAPPA